MEGLGQTPHRFVMSDIIGDPFILSSLSISLLGWLMALGGSIAVQLDSGTPPFFWWGLAFQLGIMLGVVYIVGTDIVDVYRLALLACLGTAIIYTTNATNTFVWAKSSLRVKSAAASAITSTGYILLSVVDILWVLYFGTDDRARLHSFVDSYSIARRSARRSTRNPFDQYRDTAMTQPTRGHVPPQMLTSAHLNAFENSSEARDNFAPGAGSDTRRDHGISDFFAQNNSNGNNINNNNNKTIPSQSNRLQPNFGNTLSFSRPSSSNTQTGAQSTSDALTVPTEYPYRAKAVYSYIANPVDANEISFDAGEILEISDITGRWWQARRANGEVGICPSNYVLLEAN